MLQTKAFVTVVSSNCLRVVLRNMMFGASVHLHNIQLSFLCKVTFIFKYHQAIKKQLIYLGIKLLFKDLEVA